MNSSSQDAQSRRTESAPRVDQTFREAGPPERIDVVDPTEDLANDVTSELPGTGTRPHVAPPALAGTASVVADVETAGVATVMTTGAALRDRYVLGPPLGYGGTSVVYRARDLRRAEVADECADVAIKILRPEFRDRPRCIARLRREFHQTQSLAHPNVVRFYDLDCDRGNWFIAMELLVGESLGRRMRHASPAGLPIGEALRIAVACCDALACAHDHGVTHGDIKPDNVFITASGDVRILDFGVAPESLQPQTPEGQAVPDPLRGAVTRAYASPEVLSGQSPESRDDVFSLACLTYEMLAGKHPYGRRGADEALRSGPGSRTTCRASPCHSGARSRRAWPGGGRGGRRFANYCAPSATMRLTLYLCQRRCNYRLRARQPQRFRCKSWRDTCCGVRSGGGSGRLSSASPSSSAS